MKVVAVGAGYVGAVSGACLAHLGHDVTCVDRAPERVDAIRRGIPPVHEPGLAALLASPRLTATTDLQAAMAGCEVVLIAVGTPPGPDGIDLTQIEAAARSIGACLGVAERHCVIAVKSTVVPGTTDGVVRRAVEGAAGGRAFGLCANPEFLREGSAVADFLGSDRVVIGADDAPTADRMRVLYEALPCPQLVTTVRNAELIKYASNAVLATLVSFSNELATLCEAVPGTDVETVLDGVHLDRRLTSIVGGRHHRPGILDYLRAGSGFGGSCLPKDVDALRAFARARRVETPLLDAVVTVNRARPERLVSLIEETIGAVRERTIALLGLAFKPGTDDIRNSPAIALLDALLARGARIVAHDPLADDEVRRRFGARIALPGSAPEAVGGADAAVIATGWPEFATLDWAALAGRMRRPVVIDARNALRGVAMPSWVRYVGVGRMPGGEEAVHV